MRWAVLAFLLLLAAAATACRDEDGAVRATPGDASIVLAFAGATGAPLEPTGAVAFECPVTLPSGEKPFEEPRPFPTQHREGEMYTRLDLDGVTHVRPQDRTADGGFEPRWMFWRPTAGASMSVEGRRLDAPAPPLIAKFGDGYHQSQLWVGSLYFPTGGCWEVIARSGGSEMRFVTIVTEGR